MAAVHVQCVLCQSASADLEDHGRTLARRVVILLHRVGQALARREIHDPPTRHSQCRSPTLCRVLTFGLHGDLLVAPDIELPLSKRLLIQLSPFRRRRDRIEHSALGDARFYIFGHQRVTVAGDPDSRILGSISHKERRLRLNVSFAIHEISEARLGRQ